MWQGRRQGRRPDAGPAELRDAIEATREYRGVNGLFSYSPTDHLGLDRRSTFLVTVKDGKFELLGE